MLEENEMDCPSCRNTVRETVWRSKWVTPSGVVVVVVENSRRVFGPGTETKDPPLLSHTITNVTEGGQSVVIQTKKDTCQVMTDNGPVQCINAASRS